MKRGLLSFLVLFISFTSTAQLLQWTPPFITESSDPVTITVDATRGNMGLLNYSNVTDVYVHTGVITSLSTGPSDWKYVKFNQNFNQPNPALQAVPNGTNKWTFTITGGLRAYYGVTNPAEQILKIAILFRNGAGTAVQRNADGSDMYVPVYTSALAVRFTAPFMQPKFIPVPEPINKNVGETLPITAISNATANLTLYLNGTVIQTASNATTISATPTLSTAGNNQVVVDATNSTGSKRDTFNFFVANPVNVAPLPAGVRHGINYESNNTAATLVLYAPGKSRVSIIGDLPGNNWTEQSSYQMNRTPDGTTWWLRITGLTPGVEYSYQYLVNGTLRVADPYSEKIQDPWNDQFIPSSTYPNLKPYPMASTTGIVSILQTASPGYTWANNTFTRPDKRNLLIYELLVRDFIAAHDWNTLRDTLNYLKNLGINAIEIMPFSEFEGNLSWGYNPDFQFAPDKYYGPKNSLKRFIDTCHSRGIAVIMDIALNHQFGLSPMVQLYFDAANNRPTAESPWFNPEPKHPFNVGYDMNHESLATRYWTSRVVEHWLTEYKIDGFRFDLSKGFTQVNSGSNVSQWGQYDASRVAIWKRYYDTCQTKAPGSYVILEHFADNSEEIELSNYGMLLWGNMNHNFAEASMGFLANSNFEGALHTARGWTNPHLVSYMESHDEERLMYKNLQFGNSSGSYNVRDVNTALRRVELCAAFFLNMPGPKMIWQFGEVGYDYSINHCADGSVNPNCRVDPKPIRWDYFQNIPRRRLYDVNSALLALRKHPLFVAGFTSNRVTRSLSGAFKWLQVTTDTSNICVIGNFDVVPTTGTVTFQSPGTWYDYLTGATFSATGSPQTISLQPGQYHVYLNRNVTNVVTTPVNEFNINKDGLAVAVYPNPVTGNKINLKYSVPVSGKVNIDLLTSSGQVITKLFEGFKLKGKYDLPVSVSRSLPTGNYVIRLKQEGKMAVTQMISR
jgi:glycosidase